MLTFKNYFSMCRVETVGVRVVLVWVRVRVRVVLVWVRVVRVRVVLVGVRVRVVLVWVRFNGYGSFGTGTS